MWVKRLEIVILSSLLACSPLEAALLKGRVVNTNKEPIEAATVQFFSSHNGITGTSTDARGRFTYDGRQLPDSITFSRLDFKKKTLRGDSVLDNMLVVLQEKQIFGEEVTIISKPEKKEILVAETGSPNLNEYIAQVNPLFDLPSTITADNKIASLVVLDQDEHGFVLQKRKPFAGVWSGEPSLLVTQTVGHASILSPTYANDKTIESTLQIPDSLCGEIKTGFATSGKFALPLGIVHNTSVIFETKYVTSTYDYYAQRFGIAMPSGDLPHSTEYFNRLIFDNVDWRVSLSNTVRGEGMSLAGKTNTVEGFLDAFEDYREIGFKVEKFGNQDLSLAGLMIHDGIAYTNGGEEPFIVYDTEIGENYFSGVRRAESDQFFLKTIMKTPNGNIPCIPGKIPIAIVLDVSIQNATALERTHTTLILDDPSYLTLLGLEDELADSLHIEHEDSHVTTWGLGIEGTKPFGSTNIHVGLRVDHSIASYRSVQFEPAAEIRWEGQTWDVKLLRHNIYSPGGTDPEKTGLNNGTLTTTTLLGGSYNWFFGGGFLRTEGFVSKLDAVEQEGSIVNGYSYGLASQFVRDVGQWRFRVQGSTSSTQLGEPGKPKYYLRDDSRFGVGINMHGPIYNNINVFVGFQANEGKPYTGANIKELQVPGVGSIPYLEPERKNMRRNPWEHRISCGLSYTTTMPKNIGALTFSLSTTNLGAMLDWNKPPIRKKHYLLQLTEGGVEKRIITTREQPLVAAEIKYEF